MNDDMPRVPSTATRVLYALAVLAGVVGYGFALSMYADLNAPGACDGVAGIACGFGAVFALFLLAVTTVVVVALVISAGAAKRRARRRAGVPDPLPRAARAGADAPFRL
jgi:hypothetical protein